jgi:murein DD-endopeptidase MepM/ murein hydrolase activator NlpD
MLRTRLAPAAFLGAVAALCMLLLCGHQARGQDLESKLEAKEAKLFKVEAHKGVLTTTIARDGQRIDRLTGAVASLRREEAAVRVRLDAKQVELDRALAVLGGARRHLDVVRAQLKRALTHLRDHLVAIYETGNPDLLSVIVGARGYQDLVDRTEYLNRIHGLDEAVVTRVRELRDEVRRTVLRLRAAKDRIEAARDAIAAEQEALANARRALQRRQAALAAARRRRLDALGRIRQTEQKLDGDVAAIQEKLAARLAGMSSPPLPAGPIRVGSGSGLIWPVDGPVVSGFGPRFGGREFHEGIDIAVPTGTPIRAAANGTVLFTEPEASSGGYGNFTCIDHGGGLATCYAHQESFAVSAGQHVVQGEIIGYSDCTGHCFGPHVHFEVRVNGTPVDPMGYL